MKIVTSLIWIFNAMFLAHLAFSNDYLLILIPSVLCFVIGGFYANEFDKQINNNLK